MIKSPLRYPGGKSRVADLIASLIPEFDEYREPFVGGGSVFINLKQKFPDKQYWINDLHPNLYKFWEQSQSELDLMVHQIDLWKNGQFYGNGKLLYNHLTSHIDNFCTIEKAAAFFVLNRITFSGTTESGGYSEQAYKGRFTHSSIERLKKLGTILTENVNITNLDYKEVVDKNGEKVFIYLDPPYYSAKKSALYGKNGNLHTNFDHGLFAETMKNCKHKWLITYDDSEYIRNLFSFAHITPFNIVYGMKNVTNKKNNQQGKELFLTNYVINKNEIGIIELSNEIFKGNQPMVGEELELLKKAYKKQLKETPTSFFK